MTLDQFIVDFSAEFEMTDASEFTADTAYRDLEEWDSLLGLTMIGMVNNKYHVKISGADLREAGTIGNLYNLIISRQA